MLQQILHIYFKTITDLIPIINPIAVALFFLSFTAQEDNNAIKIYASKVGIYAAITMIFTLFAGEIVLRFFGLTVDYVRVVGGILVFAMGWKMLNRDQNDDLDDEHKPMAERLFYPVTMPFAIGGGTLAVILSLSTYIDTNSFKANSIENMAAVAGILTTSILIILCCRFSKYLKKILGDGGTTVFMFIFALLILYIGVSISWSGAKPLIQQLFTG